MPIVTACLLLSPRAHAQEAPDVEAPRVLVLDLRSQGVELKDATVLGEEVVAALRDAGDREVVSQADIREMLTVEAQRKLMGCDDDGCVAEIAGTLGARYVVAGSAVNLGRSIHVRLTLLDTLEGKQERSANAESGDLAELRDLVRSAAFDLVDAPYRPRLHREVAWPVNELVVRAGALAPFALTPAGPSISLAWVHRTGNVAYGPVVGWSRSQTDVVWDDLFDPYTEPVGLDDLRAGGLFRWPARGGTWGRFYVAVEAGLSWTTARSLGTQPPAWSQTPETNGRAFGIYFAPTVGLRLLPRAPFGFSLEAGWRFDSADPGVYDHGQPLALEAPPAVGDSRGSLGGVVLAGVFSYGF